MTFESKEQHLAWALHETQYVLEEAQQMKNIGLPPDLWAVTLVHVVCAVLEDNQRVLVECGYQVCPTPQELNIETGLRKARWEAREAILRNAFNWYVSPPYMESEE